MRAEHAGRVLLAAGDRTGVVQQRAERAAFDTHIDSEHVFAHEIEERAAGRDFGECDAALVARRRPGMFAQHGVVGDCARERRQNLRGIAMDGGHHATRDELRRVLQQPDEFVDHLRDFDRHRAFGALALRKQEHRRLGMPFAQLVEQGGGLLMRRFRIAAEIPVEQHGTQRRIGADDRQSVLARQRPDYIDVARFQLLREAFRRSPNGGIQLRQSIIDDENTWS